MPDNILTENDLLKQLDQKLEGGATGTTIKIGDQDISLTDTTALANAINELNTRNSREIEGLKQVNQELQRRYVEPEKTAPAPTTPATPAPAYSKDWAIDAYAEALRKDPVKAHDEALARALGLAPGTSAAQALQTLAATNMGTAQMVQQLQKELQEERQAAEVERFLSSHPDYEPSPEHLAVLDRHMQANGLQFNSRGLHLAYLEGVNNGEIKRKEVHQEQQFTQNAGLPSLRNSQAVASPEVDFETYRRKLDKLSPTEGLDVIHSLFKQQQGH